MIIVICAVRDNKVDSYAQPMYLPSTGVAIRSFIDTVNTEDNNSNLWRHPEDFELWHIANFDDVTGKFENIDHKSLAVGSAVKLTKRENNRA